MSAASSWSSRGRPSSRRRQVAAQVRGGAAHQPATVKCSSRSTRRSASRPCVGQRDAQREERPLGSARAASSAWRAPTDDGGRPASSAARRRGARRAGQRRRTASAGRAPRHQRRRQLLGQVEPRRHPADQLVAREPRPAPCEHRPQLGERAVACPRRRPGRRRRGCARPGSARTAPTPSISVAHRVGALLLRTRSAGSLPAGSAHDAQLESCARRPRAAARSIASWPARVGVQRQVDAPSAPSAAPARAPAPRSARCP